MDANLEWLQQRREHYRVDKNDLCEPIEDFDDLSKLGQGFTSVDPLEKVDIGDGTIPRPTFVNKNLDPLFTSDLIKLLKEYVDCFAWNYNEMPGLSRDLVEHHYLLYLILGLINNLVETLILIFMTEWKRKSIDCLMQSLVGLVVMLIGFLILCPLRKRDKKPSCLH
jgi:hypothetical protein